MPCAAWALDHLVSEQAVIIALDVPESNPALAGLGLGEREVRNRERRDAAPEKGMKWDDLRSPC